VAGDKVLIALKPNITKTKHFYIKKVIRPHGRIELEALERDMGEARWLDSFL
jgi:hypothetical protein